MTTTTRDGATIIFLLLAAACSRDAPRPRNDAAPNLAVPAWSADVTWYQIFVERFSNGDPSNDPTAHDIEGFSSEPTPDGWQPTPWSQDWYRREPWARASGKDFYGTAQFRRYGGDLKGVLDRLDYLHAHRGEISGVRTGFTDLDTLTTVITVK